MLAVAFLSTRMPTIPRSASSTAITSTHHFYSYATQITLWLATSALYRESYMFEKALSSLSEAKNLADTLSKMESRVQGRKGHLFQESDGMRNGIFTSLSSLHIANSSRNWELADAKIRRILADIALEVRLE